MTNRLVTSTAAQQQMLEWHAGFESSLWKMQDDAFIFVNVDNFKHCKCISFLWNANLQ